MMAMADKIGDWKIYSCYSNITEIAPAGNDIFVVASGNLYSYNIENSIQTYDKTNGLSSSDITHIAWVPAVGKLIVTYSDYNIDLVKPTMDVEFIDELANKQTTYDKTVNSIYVSGKYAYLSTAFGIVKIDAEGGYIADTYNLGFNVDYCYIEGDYLYAESPTEGKYQGLLKANLLDKNNWVQAGNYTPKQKETYIHDAKNSCYWAQGDNSRLTQYKLQADGSFKPTGVSAKPDGPAYAEHSYIKWDHGRLLSIRGLYEYYANLTLPGFVQEYNCNTGTWSVYDNSLATETDKECVAHMQIDVNPLNPNHIAIGSRSGLYEYIDGKMVAYYDMNSNDPIISVIDKPRYSIISGLKFDQEGNIWMFNMGNTAILCKTAAGEWKAFKQDQLKGNDHERYKHPFFDSRGLMWFSNDWSSAIKIGFYDIKSNQLRGLYNIINKDNKLLGDGKHVFTTVEDKEHNIWIGGEIGCVYLTPEDIREMCSTTDMSNIRVTQHKIPRNDGTNLADYLLDNVWVKNIKIDAANRKWMATTNGVYVISSDCNTQEAHFTTQNSPLLSNEVRSIAFDETTGVVYFATDKGLCSYQSDIIENTYGDLSDDNVYAYPNPVTPDYTGDITIVGLMDSASIKITNSAGFVVNEGVCMGGSYKWNGKDQHGNKVASGVYMVMSANEEGKNTLTKIAVIR